eukprot:TRINITY_DN8461_c0_g1_i7.p1 TRINITY_DN8461_c0_g1~~TRINITY_DN8461_c0_g1_i7.p1  ORF type:complete len:1234 (+),score=303.00 TRINITY_DN8461_c0_g1_i7:50-3751(+)
MRQVRKRESHERRRTVVQRHEEEDLVVDVDGLDDSDLGGNVSIADLLKHEDTDPTIHAAKQRNEYETAQQQQQQQQQQSFPPSFFNAVVAAAEAAHIQSQITTHPHKAISKSRHEKDTITPMMNAASHTLPHYDANGHRLLHANQVASAINQDSQLRSPNIGLSQYSYDATAANSLDIMAHAAEDLVLIQATESHSSHPIVGHGTNGIAPSYLHMTDIEGTHSHYVSSHNEQIYAHPYISSVHPAQLHHPHHPHHPHHHRSAHEFNHSDSSMLHEKHIYPHSDVRTLLGPQLESSDALGDEDEDEDEQDDAEEHEEEHDEEHEEELSQQQSEDMDDQAETEESASDHGHRLKSAGSASEKEDHEESRHILPYISATSGLKAIPHTSAPTHSIEMNQDGKEYLGRSFQEYTLSVPTPPAHLQNQGLSTGMSQGAKSVLGNSQQQIHDAHIYAHSLVSELYSDNDELYGNTVIAMDETDGLYSDQENHRNQSIPSLQINTYLISSTTTESPNAGLEDGKINTLMSIVQNIDTSPHGMNKERMKSNLSSPENQQKGSEPSRKQLQTKAIAVDPHNTNISASWISMPASDSRSGAVVREDPHKRRGRFGLGAGKGPHARPDFAYAANQPTLIQDLEEDMDVVDESDGDSHTSETRDSGDNVLSQAGAFSSRMSISKQIMAQSNNDEDDDVQQEQAGHQEEDESEEDEETVDEEEEVALQPEAEQNYKNQDSDESDESTQSTNSGSESQGRNQGTQKPPSARRKEAEAAEIPEPSETKLEARPLDEPAEFSHPLFMEQGVSHEHEQGDHHVTEAEPIDTRALAKSNRLKKMKLCKEYHMIVSYLQTLKELKARSMEDQEKLKRWKSDALHNPLRFVECLVDKRLPTFPVGLHIPEIPHLELERYEQKSFRPQLLAKTPVEGLSVNTSSHHFDIIGLFDQVEIDALRKENEEVQLKGRDGVRRLRSTPIFFRARQERVSDSSDSSQSQEEPPKRASIFSPNRPAVKPQEIRSPSSEQPTPANPHAWTEEENRRLLELLEQYPEEEVAIHRWKKISADLGTRTPKQVASRMQKLYRKLGTAEKRRLGLPCKTEHKSSSGNRKSKNGRKRKEDSDDSTTEQEEPTNSLLHTAEQNEGKIGSPESKRSRLASPPREVSIPRNKIHEGYQCDSCQAQPIVGTRYECQDCTDMPIDLCEACHNSGKFGRSEHPPEHRFLAVTTAENLDDADGFSHYLDPNYLGS